MMELFAATIANVPELAGVYLNKDDPLPVTSAPFVKLQVKPRKQVLADGLGSKGYDWSNNGKKLQPALWHSSSCSKRRQTRRCSSTQLLRDQSGVV
jgi:predicted sulfurtransferase